MLLIKVHSYHFGEEFYVNADNICAINTEHFDGHERTILEMNNGSTPVEESMEQVAQLISKANGDTL